MTVAGRMLCLGKFEALHRGHLALLSQASAVGEPAILEMIGMAEVLGWPQRPALIAPPDRARILADWEQRCGCTIPVLRVPFDELRGLEPLQFCHWLRDSQGVRGIVVGPDFRFAVDRSGDVAFLLKHGPALGLSIRVVPAVCDAQGVVSSSRIRSALERGAVEEASMLYGRPHRIYGVVREGDGRGRTLGFPTANLGEIANLVPADGVYAGMAEDAAGQRWLAAINIGVVPTVAAGRQRSVEVHLLDFCGDLYGTAINVQFHHRLRGEQRFASITELTRQIEHDVAQVRHLREHLLGGVA